MSVATKRIVICGAGGLGREVLQTLREQRAAGAAVEVLGFMVDAEAGGPAVVKGMPVYRDLDALAADPALHFVVAIGNPATRARFAARIAHLAGPRFATVIHPASVLGESVEVCAGSIILQAVSVTADVRIGRHTVINPQTSIAHDCVLEDFVSIAPAVTLTGGVHVEIGCEIGAGATVIPRQRIGCWSIIGAGAVVIAPVAANTTMAGVPARCIATRPAGWQKAPDISHPKP
jgi:acetyltransferase EpsM